MKLALIGATGFVGSAILAEGLARGHQITAIARHPEKLAAHPGLTAVRGDATRPADLAAVLSGHDAAISAFNPATDARGEATAAIIAAVQRAEVKRLLVVGGAGSLEVAPGERLVDQPDFPAQWKEGALRTAKFLDQLRAEPALDWSFLSPAPILEPGRRTGVFRIGGDQLLALDGRISVEDYALAMLDETERPAHSRRRFSVAY